MKSWQTWIGMWITARLHGDETTASALAHAPEQWYPRGPHTDGARVLCAALARYRVQNPAHPPLTLDDLHGTASGDMCAACRDLKLHGPDFPEGATVCSECASDAQAWGTLPSAEQQKTMLTKDQRRALRNADGQRRRLVLPAQ